MLNGILIGLEYKDDALVFKKKIFPCCEGEGQYYDQRTEKIYHCNLIKRFRKTEALFHKYESIWPEQFPKGIHLDTDQKSAQILRKVADVLKGNSPQAYLKMGNSREPSYFWSMAMAYTWRFGIDVHFTSMKNGASLILPNIDKIDPKKPLAIFAEQVDKLWDPGVAANFEGLINFAYKGNAMLWVEFVTGNEQREPSNPDDLDGSSAIREFNKRISRLKSKHPFEFLDANSISRLTSLCTYPRQQY